MSEKLKNNIGEGTKVGLYTVIEDGAIIGRNCLIGHHAVIREKAVIGDNVRIDDFADIGKLPMIAANSAATEEKLSYPKAKISDGAIIGTGAVVYAGANIEKGVLVADLATVREDVTIGEKTIIGRGAAIENKCKIGAYCKIETNAYICAYSEIEDRCFVAPCVVTSNDNFAGRTEERYKKFGGVKLKKGARLGAGTVVLPNKTVNEDGFAAAGSVVTKDINSKEIVAGNPAKKLRDVPKEQLLSEQKLKK